MPISPYCKAYPAPGRPGHTLLFSTRKASLSVLPAGAVTRLERGDVPDGAAGPLERLGVLAPDPEAERREVLGLLDEVNRVDPGVTAAVILGMSCNFACPYCYEGTLKGTGAMSASTAEALVAFAARRLGPGKTRLTLDFYGGEPLLYLERLRQIASALRPVAEERGAAFSFTLVTNGSLLTPDVVTGLLPLGLAAARVTLDGPAETHDRSRPLRTGGGSFEAVLANVQACCDLAPLAVGGNYTRENWREFPRLLDRLEASGLGPGRLAQVRFEPVVQVRSRFAPPEFAAGCLSADEPWVVEASLALREEVLRRGFKTARIQPTPCMADLDDAFTVHWDGGLYKCLALVGHPEFAAGDLWSGPRDHRAAYGGERWRTEARCCACEYLPLCFGGCRYLRYQREGRMDGVECRKAYLDAALEALVQQDALHRHGVR
ncbi:MAG: geopeptide radical SAM maturase [Deltaproteobacteria bacterium]|nr:geopeptide radical SAM maturase [Deltaproteobacteria bacterium]